MVGLTTLLVDVALLVAQVVVIEQIRRQREANDRVHGLYRALARDVAELRGDVPPLREHVLREAGLKKEPHLDYKSNNAACQAPADIGDLGASIFMGRRAYLDSYDDELDAALKQCAVEE